MTPNVQGVPDREGGVETRTKGSSSLVSMVRVLEWHRICNWTSWQINLLHSFTIHPTWGVCGIMKN